MNTHPSQEAEAKCSICLLGDGKWKEGRNTKDVPPSLICELCRKDGWKQATSEDILADEAIKDLVNHESPFRNNESLS